MDVARELTSLYIYIYVYIYIYIYIYVCVCREREREREREEALLVFILVRGFSDFMVSFICLARFLNKPLCLITYPGHFLSMCKK
jgi:hypothetical protein